MRIPSFFTVASLLVALALVSPPHAFPQSGRYFPERGPAAITQRSLEVQHPTVVMIVACEPGMEDFPTIAWLRLATGAQVVSVYATNGEATPSDYSGETPADLAGRRKLEAVRSMSLLGAEALFLNLRDAGVLTRRSALETTWDLDSARAHLSLAIRERRPDVVMLTVDQRNDSGSTVRQGVLRDLIIGAIRDARSARWDFGAATTLAGRSWLVQRFFVDTGMPGEPVHAPVGMRHPIWNKTYEAIGAEAAAEYASLRGSLALWWSVPSRGYTPVGIEKEKLYNSLTGGLLLSDAKLGPIARGVSSVLAVIRGGKPMDALKPLLAVLEDVDFAVARHTAGFSNLDRRAIVLWKNSLENLRCAVLDVDVEYEMSDSLLTQRQVFFLRFRKFTAKIASGPTQILFPGVGQGDWIVTEANSQVFPFTAPKEYQILTPEKMEFNRPALQFGLRASTLTTNFAFIIFHRDSVRERSFVYRKEIPLGIGPRGTAELLTPVVRLTPGERLVFGVWNYMRDPLKGEAYVLDSLATAGPRLFALPRKDGVELDTLVLNWKKDVPDGNFVMDLSVWDRPRARRLIVRKFDAVSDTVHSVGVITGVEGSPLVEALRRLHVRTVSLGAAAIGLQLLDSLRTVVIDRDALALCPECSAWMPAIGSWVSSGGHLVVLSQYETPGKSAGFTRDITFISRPHLETSEPVLIDSSSALLLSPNRIGPGDWEDWVVSRAMGSIQITGRPDAHVCVRSARAALLVSAPQGRGQVTFVALDLSSQLLDVHPGAYRLLANLVSAR